MFRTLKLILLLPVLSCARPQAIIEPVSDDFTVQVKTEGRVVNNFEQRLVHRIDVPLNIARGFKLSVDSGGMLPISVKMERDSRGAISGARVVSPNSRALEALGLKPKDLLTAVGKAHITSPKVLRVLFTSIANEKQAMMTIVRQGRPHKLLYSVVN